MSPVKYHDQSDCVMPRGTKNSRCAQVASRLSFTEAEVVRVARMANRNAKAYDRYRDDLAQAKAERAIALADRDEHMAECPAAADRFAVSA